jgi:hypothetical protein
MINKSTNINKTNNHLKHQTINKKRYIDTPLLNHYSMISSLIGELKFYTILKQLTV